MFIIFVKDNNNIINVACKKKKKLKLDLRKKKYLAIPKKSKENLVAR